MTQTIMTTSRVTRLAGGILVQTNGKYYLVGQLKEPCDFLKQGFESPSKTVLDGKKSYIPLKAIATVTSDEEIVLVMETQGEALAELLFKRFVILRNHSVSDRLWRVVASGKDDKGHVDARWLEQMPDDAWEIIKESILKCL